MARRKAIKSTLNEERTADYRHPREKRSNIPLGLIAGEGTVPKVPKVRYFYSPHLPPKLQFDSTGGPDKLNDLLDKATRAQLSTSEAGQLRDALRRYEPWLEWSGKREKPWFEVDPVVLHMHERVSTQAILRVLAREDVERDLFADPQQDYAEAVQFYRHEVDWANRMILGDSLQVMASLVRREGLAGKMQMIYLDPPYGISFRSNFQPDLGNVQPEDKERDLTREPEMVKAYRDTWTLGTHSYLAYLRDRLVMARELLADAGSIFVQISDENLHRVRSLLDEVFGPSNFVTILTFTKKGSQTGEFVPPINEYIIWYARAREKALSRFRPIYAERADSEPETFPYGELDTGEVISAKRPDLSSISGRIRFFSSNALFSQKRGPNDPVMLRGRAFPSGGNSWKISPLRVPFIDKAERTLYSHNRVRFKRYADDFAAVELSNVWTDLAGTPDKIYVVQTNPRVIERCMLMTTDPGDLVLDPTCGSGTTAYVAEQWGRRWITCDSSRVALALAKHRLMTAKFDYYQLRPVSVEDVSRNSTGAWLTDLTGKVPGKATFQCKTVPHIQLSSIARNTTLDAIFSKHEPILAEKLENLNREVAKIGGPLKEKLVEKLIRKHREEGANAVTDADTRRWLLPDTQPALLKSMPARKPFRGLTPKQVETYRKTIPKSGWKEWEVPFDKDSDWPKSLQDSLTAFRTAWRAKMDDVNGCIAANAEVEELVDKPEIVKGVVRVSGPFTVEGVSPEELNLDNEGLVDGSQNDLEDEESANLAAIHQQNLQAYLGQMVQLIDQDGLTFLNNKRRRFSQVESLFDAATGAVLHAEGSWDDSPLPGILDVAIGFGPQYGPVTAQQVEGLIHACKRYSELVVAGFSFDADATALIQEQTHPKLRIHQAYIRPDVNPGMTGLLKETPDSQLFTVFGTPEIGIAENEAGDWIVELKGVDIYDPVANTIRSTGADKVAAWFLDSDFDGRCFCITQAFFPNQDAWEKIAKALGSAADMDAFEAFKGTTSVPFSAGMHKRVAVKVIDPRGNEVMVVRALEA